MPFSSNMFDIVVSTLVFCSVSDPEQSLQEVFRVLKPGGIFLGVEHIYDDDQSILGVEQKVLDPLQQIIANGCHLTRRTDLLLQRHVNDNKSDMFSQILESKIIYFPSEWPISKQWFFAAKNNSLYIYATMIYFYLFANNCK